jgi:dTDP-4-dehydrorhamnose 3,5-epimerase
MSEQKPLILRVLPKEANVSPIAFGSKPVLDYPWAAYRVAVGTIFAKAEREMAQIREFDRIAGLLIADLKAWSDDRGQFIETFRKEWFPQRSWARMQINRSDSRPGVLRGLHYHLHQVDYWYVPRGVIRVGLADLRPTSPTYLKSAVIELAEHKPMGLLIPIGVAHGFVALTDATLTYTVDNYHDGTDEHGVAWNDPDLDVPWDIREPLLSPRDQQNPFYKAIPHDRLPREEHSVNGR